MITIKLYELSYDTYSYHGGTDAELESPDSANFDLDDGKVLGIYSSYELALQKKEFFSTNYSTNNLKRLNIYDVLLDRAEWEEGFITLGEC
ncbi:hypothetical protein RHO12_02985 [Orbus sturtevantii]|uniref:hypothetical protein n=1 Tax=Orbus sturtevantii TaxID=3074109 RepID=UPI00370D595C